MVRTRAAEFVVSAPKEPIVKATSASAPLFATVSNVAPTAVKEAAATAQKDWSATWPRGSVRTASRTVVAENAVQMGAEEAAVTA